MPGHVNYTPIPNGDVKTHRLQVSVSDSNGGIDLGLVERSRTAFHINNNHEFDASVREPAIHGKTLIDSLQESKILLGCLVRHPDIENIEA